MTQPTPRDPNDRINPDANREAEAAKRDQSSYLARAGQNSGTVDSGPAPSDEQPAQAVQGGTAAANPLAGVTANDTDLQDVVRGDTGPHHRKQR